MAKLKFDIGDRMANIAANSLNYGKHGTIVDYDSTIKQYAIVYDDGSTGVGHDKNYDPIPGHAIPVPTDAYKMAKKELAAKTLQATTSMSSSMLTAADLQQAIDALQKLTQSKINNQSKMAMPTDSNYHNAMGAWSGGNTFFFAHPNHDYPPEVLRPGLPVVLLSGSGFADPRKEANPIWKDTGITGEVRQVQDRGNGEIEADIRWGSGQRNLYIVNNGSCMLQFAPWASDFKVKPKFTIDAAAFDRLVLEASVKKEILAVLKQYENRDHLFDTWGLGETIEYGRGMTMMFWGGPGTGKTYGAHCIAKALGQQLLSISAAEVQSSEPGATERNIQQAFTSAKEENKVLFIDECDSIITTRADLGMVLAAQVNCLLTEIEKFEGVCILATNRIETMDEALERRIALIVEFPFPKYAQRTEIWKKLLPSKMPLAEGVTAEVLAQPKFSGGQIKNIILQAARLAVADTAPAVTQAHFDSAVQRINKSKGIMGQLARSSTGRPRQDMSVGVDIGVGNNVQIERSTKVSLESFLATDEEEDKKDDKTV